MSLVDSCKFFHINFHVFYVIIVCLLAESEGDLQRVANEFSNVCKRWKLKVNAGNSKVMVFGEEGRRGD